MATRPLIAIGAILLIVGAVIVGALGCQSRKAPQLTPEEIAQIVEGQPRIFIEKEGALTLEGVEELYLGQSEADAMAILERICAVVEVYEGGWRHKDAAFKGCIVEDGAHLKTIRAGFWPHNDNRVSTLEIKEAGHDPKLVRARFTEVGGPLSEDMPRPGVLIMASERYRLFANWDEGAKGPTHITIGFQP
ncbi:MAG: hypothetical protein ACNA8W_21685 [Bradymonadaceae bacterium]